MRLIPTPGQCVATDRNIIYNYLFSSHNNIKTYTAQHKHTPRHAIASPRRPGASEDARAPSSSHSQLTPLTTVTVRPSRFSGFASLEALSDSFLVSHRLTS